MSQTLSAGPIDLSCLPLFVMEEQPSRPVFLKIDHSFENCTECKILFRLAGLFGRGHVIKELLIDNNFMRVFYNFMVAIDEYFVMSHCQGSTELEYRGGLRVQLYMLTNSIRNR